MRAILVVATALAIGLMGQARGEKAPRAVDLLLPYPSDMKVMPNARWVVLLEQGVWIKGSEAGLGDAAYLGTVAAMNAMCGVSRKKLSEIIEGKSIAVDVFSGGLVPPADFNDGVAVGIRAARRLPITDQKLTCSFYADELKKIQ